jgi:hypothetical protein
VWHVIECGDRGHTFLDELLAASLHARSATVNPEDPESAQRIVAEYASVLERHFSNGDLPATLESLPYPKQTIKSAIRTSVETIASAGLMTDELREFLRTAYVSLADYVGADLVALMNEYRRAADDVAADRRLANEKTSGAAWQTLANSGTLAGEIARTIASDAEVLSAEFSSFSG